MRGPGEGCSTTDVEERPVVEFVDCGDSAVPTPVDEDAVATSDPVQRTRAQRTVKMPSRYEDCFMDF